MISDTFVHFARAFARACAFTIFRRKIQGKIFSPRKAKGERLARKAKGERLVRKERGERLAPEGESRTVGIVLRTERRDPPLHEGKGSGVPARRRRGIHALCRGETGRSSDPHHKMILSHGKGNCKGETAAPFPLTFAISKRENCIFQLFLPLPLSNVPVREKRIAKAKKKWNKNG